MLPYEQWSVTTLIFALAFKLVMAITWILLQGFIASNDQNFRKPQSIAGGILAIALIVVFLFAILRITFINVLVVINSKLPAALESAYFAYFAVQMMFFLYYRYLFLTVKDWGMTFLLLGLVLAMQFVLYPLYMTKTAYNFRFHVIKNWILSKHPKLSFLIIPAIDGDLVTYEQWTMDLSIEYYWDQLAEYYSLVMFVIFVTLKKFLYTYNSYSQYRSFWNPTVPLLDDNGVQIGTKDIYPELMQRYAVLFAFELITDLFLQYIPKRFLGVKIASIGRNTTIYNFRPRFLFTIFLVYFVIDINYSVIDRDVTFNPL